MVMMTGWTRMKRQRLDGEEEESRWRRCIQALNRVSTVGTSRRSDRNASQADNNGPEVEESKEQMDGRASEEGAAATNHDVRN